MQGTVFSVALNHRSQLNVWEQAFHAPPYQTPPQTPVWFIKPRNTYLANGGVILLPAKESVFSGATLAVIIGQSARKISIDSVPDYIAGYALANDVSLAETSFYRPAIREKCRDGFCPLGEMTSRVNLNDLQITTEINDVQQDCWTTNDLVRSAAELIVALTDFITLRPGDAVLIGTPYQRVPLHPGDKITIRAAGLPSLMNTVMSAGELP